MENEFVVPGIPPFAKNAKDEPPAVTVYLPQAWQVIGDSGNRGVGIHFCGAYHSKHPRFLSSSFVLQGLYCLCLMWSFP